MKINFVENLNAKCSLESIGEAITLCEADTLSFSNWTYGDHAMQTLGYDTNHYTNEQLREVMTELGFSFACENKYDEAWMDNDWYDENSYQTIVAVAALGYQVRTRLAELGRVEAYTLENQAHYIAAAWVAKFDLAHNGRLYYCPECGEFIDITLIDNEDGSYCPACDEFEGTWLDYDSTSIFNYLNEHHRYDRENNIVILGCEDLEDTDGQDVECTVYATVDGDICVKIGDDVLAKVHTSTDVYIAEYINDSKCWYR